MTNKITIVEAIKQVLKTSTVGMTSQEIYNEIVQRKLYCFGAKTPEAVVHGKLRIHCKDLDFPTASPTKYFYLKKSEYYGAAEPPVRCGESHLSGLTEPLRSL